MQQIGSFVDVLA